MNKKIRKMLDGVNVAIYGSLPYLERVFDKIKIDTTACANVELSSLGRGNRHVDLIVVAFNNLQLIAEQARLVKKYMADDHYTYIVADNSTDAKVRSEIKAFCLSEGLAYIPIPRCVRFLNLSKRCVSHALALNLIYKGVVNVRKPYVFGLLDHDIFPRRQFSIVENMGDQPFSGVMRDRRKGSEGGWYLWPGYAFYKYEFTEQRKPDFQPLMVNGVFLDTGGTNYKRLYSSFDPDKMKFATERIVRVQKSEGIKRKVDTFLTDCVNMIDNDAWVHLINGSNTANIAFKAEKDRMITEFIRGLRWEDE